MGKYLSLLNKEKLFDIKKIGLSFFYLGIFLLPSALFVSIIFLLISFFLSNIFHEGKSFFRDKWNIPFILSGLFMLISVICHVFFFNDFVETNWDPILSVIGLSNWLPFFWIFWSVQSYVKSSIQRKRVALILISGSFPVLVSGICQYFLNITGPFQTLNGLIIWYQRPIQDPAGLSGLFNNANYAGVWLSLIFPFSLASCFQIKEKKMRKGFALFFLILISFGVILTNSRIAWGSLFLAIPLVVGYGSFLYLIPLTILLIIIIVLTTNPSFKGLIQDQLQLIIPDKIWKEFSSEGFEGMNVSRIGIWLSAIKFILSRPLIGFGAASFPILFELQTGFWKGHSHNLPLEIAISYGLPASITIVITIFIILFLSGKKIFLGINKQKKFSDNYFEKAWFTSLLIIIISQQVDVHYFDARISICLWILLGGLKNIIEQESGFNA